MTSSDGVEMKVLKDVMRNWVLAYAKTKAQISCAITSAVE